MDKPSRMHYKLVAKRSEAVLQWGKGKSIKKLMINGELVVEWKKKKS